ncbi:MAG TPA: GNAT family N-acetyltransferase, partial [Aquihabitans sp.]|nr:GNAT family N-acetyltransferase [Aquihabitans sp.]
PNDRSTNDAARWIAGEAERRDRGLAVDLVVADPDHHDDVLGEVGLVVVEPARRWAEVGYWLAEPARGRGRATAALTVFSDWALADLSLRRLFARTSVDNPAAAAVARGAGYELAGEAGEGMQVWVRDRDVAGTVPPRP